MAAEGNMANGVTAEVVKGEGQTKLESSIMVLTSENSLAIYKQECMERVVSRDHTEDEGCL
jgi:hypothetical protein